MKPAVWTTVVLGMAGLLVLAAGLVGMTMVWAGLEAPKALAAFWQPGSIHRPLLVALMGGLGVAFGFYRWKRKVFRWPVWGLGALMAYIVVTTVTGPLILPGDGREYILQTQALVHERSFSIPVQSVARHWNRSNPYGIVLDAEPDIPEGDLDESDQAGGGWGGLYPDGEGGWHYYHPWMYSLCAAPGYGLLHLLAPGTTFCYRAFAGFNAVCLLLAMAACLRHMNGWNLAVWGLLLCSPLLPLLHWPHPEVFCFSMIVLGFALIDVPRLRLLAPLCLGLAGAQVLPALCFLPIQAFYLCYRRTDWLRNRRRLWMASYGLALATAFAPALYYVWHFGHPSLIAKLGLADPSFATAGRIKHILFSPLSGAFWMYPALFAVPVLAIVGETSTRMKWTAATLVLAALAAAWMCAMTRNFNSAQIGCIRYANWLVAGWVWLALRYAEGLPELGRKGRGDRIAFGIAWALALALALHMRLPQLALGDERRFAQEGRLQRETAFWMRALNYRPDPETFAEQILGHEMRGGSVFNDIYIWPLSDEESLWLFSGRAMSRWSVSETAEPDAAAILRALHETYEAESAPWRVHPVWGKYAYLQVTLPHLEDAVEGLNLRVK